MEVNESVSNYKDVKQLMRVKLEVKKKGEGQRKLYIIKRILKIFKIIYVEQRQGMDVIEFKFEAFIDLGIFIRYIIFC